MYGDIPYFPKPFIRANCHKICSKTWIFGGNLEVWTFTKKTPPFQKMTKKTLRHSVVMKFGPRFMCFFLRDWPTNIFLLLPGGEKSSHRNSGALWAGFTLSWRASCVFATRPHWLMVFGGELMAQSLGFSGDHLESVGKKWLLRDWVDGIRFLVACFEKWKQNVICVGGLLLKNRQPGWWTGCKLHNI